MGLGLYIKLGQENYEYKFDFRFKRVNVITDVYEKLPSGDATEKVSKIVYYAEKENNWTWRAIE